VPHIQPAAAPGFEGDARVCPWQHDECVLGYWAHASGAGGGHSTGGDQEGVEVLVGDWRGGLGEGAGVGRVDLERKTPKVLQGGVGGGGVKVGGGGVSVCLWGGEGGAGTELVLDTHQWGWRGSQHRGRPGGQSAPGTARGAREEVGGGGVRGE
jgi:hypothetical protein